MDGLAEAARNPEFARIIQRHTDGSRRLWADFLRRAQDQGRMDPGLDADTTANILIALIDGSRALPIRNPKLDVRMNVEHLRTMLVRFLSLPDAQSVASKHPNQRAGRPLKLVRKR